MEPVMKFAGRWGAPIAAVIFFSLWYVAEAGRMGASLWEWSGAWPLALMVLAVATASWKPVVSLLCTSALLVGQLTHAIPPMASNHWAIYLGSFVALGFIIWTASLRMRFVAAGVNLLAVAAMTYLMLSWRYGAGVGWYQTIGLGDKATLQEHGWTLSSVLLLIAVACSTVGLLLALYQERGNLFRSRELAQNNLMETTVDLVVEQERTRIARDLHDVLAHSLAVIAAQADGTRYLSKDQPPAVLNALDTIAGAARRALVDAQRVIEGVNDDGLVAPQPQLSDIPGLIEGMQRGGLKIHLSDSETPVEITRGQEMAVFRIVQECLTNALKHGGRGTEVRIHFDWTGPGFTLHFASSSASGIASMPNATGPSRIGRGIPGMRERAHMAGGWLTVGPDGEYFRVTAFIPYGKRDGNPEHELTLIESAGTVAGNSSDIFMPMPAGAERQALDLIELEVSDRG